MLYTIDFCISTILTNTDFKKFVSASNFYVLHFFPINYRMFQICSNSLQIFPQQQDALKPQCEIAICSSTRLAASGSVNKYTHENEHILYILIALTIVSNDAAESMPWLFQSVNII